MSTMHVHPTGRMHSSQRELKNTPVVSNFNNTLNMNAINGSFKFAGVPNLATFVLTSVLAWQGVLRANADSTLTGAILFSADSSGAASGFESWNTLGGDGIYNLYVTTGELGDPFINSGNSALTSISIPLSPGTHTFSIFGERATQGAISHYGLNLFFNGSASPDLSVFAPRTTSSTPPYAAFTANSSANTFKLDTSPVPAAGTLSYVFSGQIITLTGFFWAAPETVFGMDRVSPANNAPSGIGDYVGQFTVSVTAVPEPTVAALLAAGLFLLAGRKRK